MYDKYSCKRPDALDDGLDDVEAVVEAGLPCRRRSWIKEEMENGNKIIKRVAAAATVTAAAATAASKAGGDEAPEKQLEISGRAPRAFLRSRIESTLFVLPPSLRGVVPGSAEMRVRRAFSYRSRSREAKKRAGSERDERVME